MPLAQVVDTLESIPEAARGAYVAKDGKFVLDFVVEDVAGLKATVEATRKERDAATAQARAWKALGKSPDEISEMLANQAALEAEAAKKRGDFDGILKQHTDKWNGERSTLVGERDTALNVARSATVDSGIKSALVTGKATGEGVALLPKILGDRVKTEFLDGAFVTTIMQADGKTPMIGSGTNGAATYDDLVKEAVKSFPSLFQGAGGGGGTPSNNGGGGSGALTMAKADFNALPPKERAAKMAQPGFKLTD